MEFTTLTPQSYKIAYDPISQILDPFRGTDLPYVYAQHSNVIDFIVYLLFFTGIARITFAQKFPGVGGKILSLAIGLMLSISLVVTQYRMNFNLASFGPFAAILILTITGLMFLQILQSYGLSTKLSASIAYITIYTSIRAFVPSIFDWFVTEVPFLAGILTIVLLVAIGYLLFSIFPKHQDGNFGSISSLAPVSSIRSISKIEEESEKQSYSIQISGKNIFDRLKKIRSNLSALFATEHGRSQILQALNDTSIESHKTYDQFKQLKSIHETIQSEDIHSLQKLLKVKENIPKQDLGKLARYLKMNQERMSIEQTVSTIDQQINGFMERFQKMIDAAIYSVQQKDGASTNKAIASAIRMESSLLRILEPSEQLERKLKANFQRVVRKIGNPSKQAA